MKPWFSLQFSEVQFQRNNILYRYKTKEVCVYVYKDNLATRKNEKTILSLVKKLNFLPENLGYFY